MRCMTTLEPLSLCQKVLDVMYFRLMNMFYVHQDLAFPKPNHRTRLLVPPKQYWDITSLITVIVFFVVQVILVLAACVSIFVLVGLVLGFGQTSRSKISELEAEADGLKLLRRGIMHVLPSPQNPLILRPFIPGITAPIFTLVPFLLALFIVQAFHEVGHTLAAISSKIVPESIGIHLYFFVFPAFSISLPQTNINDSLIDLHIGTAGIWHNFMLILLGWSMSTAGKDMNRHFLTRFGGFSPIENGVVVVNISPGSPMKQHVQPNELISILDDSPLYPNITDLFADIGTPLEQWNRYLKEGPSPENEALGWCLPVQSFRSLNPGEACCSLESMRLMDKSEPAVCFKAPVIYSPGVEGACLNPMSYFTMASFINKQDQNHIDYYNTMGTVTKQGMRCKGIPEDEGHSECGSGFKCGKVARESEIIRFTVRPFVILNNTDPERVVVWQGPRSAIKDQVIVTDLIPTDGFGRILQWIGGGPAKGGGLGWAPFTETVYFLILALSLSLTFINLLPLPSLDGSTILASFLSLPFSSSVSLATIYDLSRMELVSGTGDVVRLRVPDYGRTGLVVRVMVWMSKFLGHQLERFGHFIERIPGFPKRVKTVGRTFMLDGQQEMLNDQKWVDGILDNLRRVNIALLCIWLGSSVLIWTVVE